MLYHFTLFQVGIVLGVILLSSHLAAILKPEYWKKALKALPRQRAVGSVLLTIDFLWVLWLALSRDWGEFYKLKVPALVLLPVAYFIVLFFLEEFLTARALGILMILAADPILESAFLKPVPSRLLVVLVAYSWIILGLFWVGIPHLFRDQIDWIQKTRGRWNFYSWMGMLYAAAILVCALTVYRQH